MRQLALCVLICFLQASAPSSAGETDNASTETLWSQGLTLGINGPIPFIVVDQFGYPTQAAKIAVIRDPQMGYDTIAHFSPGPSYAVVDQSTGKVAKHGPPTAWNGGATDGVSGDRVWWFDFSDVTAPGTYAVVDLEKGLRSAEFAIDDGVYRKVLKHAMRVYFYQRAGFKKTADTVGPSWADAASHMGTGQDPQSQPWRGERSSISRLFSRQVVQSKDLHGGWFDAGDYNKYTSWTARNVITLLRAYQENPNAFGDDSGIAESGNGVPDILDEVKWALDWLERMQNTDGSLLCVQGLDQASPPSAATGPSYYGPATTAASLMGAAAFAYASKIYSAQSVAHFHGYGNDLATRAERAWEWATRNPNALYYNNDNTKQPGSAGLAAGQQEMNDAQRLFAKFQAAVYLYELTSDAKYKDFVESNYTSMLSSSGPMQWDTDRPETLLYYTRLSGISAQVKSEILTKFLANITTQADQLVSKKDPYRSPIKHYGWGSNQSKAQQARLYQLLALYGNPATAEVADSAALEYLHYIHGVNPLGLVYLTNMRSAGAKYSASTMFHNWFAHGTRWERASDTMPGPPPGYLVGGPNPEYSKDVCCTASIGTSGYRCNFSSAFLLCGNSYSPPIGQPALKSYRQFNDGWPANSWSVTEPSTGYQASYISALAHYVH